MNFIHSKAAKGAAALSLAMLMALPALAGCSSFKMADTTPAQSQSQTQEDGAKADTGKQAKSSGKSASSSKAAKSSKDSKSAKTAKPSKDSKEIRVQVRLGQSRAEDARREQGRR